MTPEAAEWDREHGRSVAHHVIEDGKFVPINRPCDWCGRKVKRGFIHDDCSEKERALHMDVIYG